MKKKKKTKKKKTKGKKKTKWLNKPKWHCRAIVTFYTVNRYTISGSTHWTTCFLSRRNFIWVFKMGFLDLFIVALMPTLEILLITAIGLFLATERINLLGANARPYLNNVSQNFLLFNIGLLTNKLQMLLVKFQNQTPYVSVKCVALCCNLVSRSSCTYKDDDS